VDWVVIDSLTSCLHPHSHITYTHSPTPSPTHTKNNLTKPGAGPHDDGPRGRALRRVPLRLRPVNKSKKRGPTSPPVPSSPRASFNQQAITSPHTQNPPPTSHTHTHTNPSPPFPPKTNQPQSLLRGAAQGPRQGGRQAGHPGAAAGPDVGVPGPGHRLLHEPEGYRGACVGGWVFDGWRGEVGYVRWCLFDGVGRVCVCSG
jgi:hypothetical protein